LSDFDSDGDLDLGTNSSSVLNPGMWIARAPQPQAVTVSKRNTAPQTRIGISAPPNTGSAAQFAEDVGGANASVPDTHYFNATSAEMLIGEITWYCTGGGSSVDFNFIPKPDPSTSALWFEDGAVTGKVPADSSLTVGPPVHVGFVPEPATATSLALIALGLLARRRSPCMT
jgi:hypothetical protein